MGGVAPQAHGLTFPCEFPVKAMGRASATFTETAWTLVTAHAPDTPADNLRFSESRGGRYLSVTITIWAHSLDQLNAIYADLQGHQDILATL